MVFELIGRRAVIQLITLVGVVVGAACAQTPANPRPTTSSGVPASASVDNVSPATHVVIKVGKAEVTQEEFESNIGDFEAEGGEGEAAVESSRRKRGEDYASVLMLSQLAVADHLDTSPDIKRQLEVARIQVLSDAEFASLMRQTEPTSAEISQYYSAHQSDFDQAHIRRLFIWKRGGGSNNTRGLSPEDARARADKILQTSAAGGDAQKLAEEFKNSQDGMIDTTPLIFPRGELPPRMEKPAFGLKEGEWSEVEDTPDSILLLQVVQHTHRQLGEVTSLVENRLHSQKVQAKLDDLKKSAGIWMDQEYFGNASAPASAAKVPTSARPTLQQPTNQEEKKQ